MPNQPPAPPYRNPPIVEGVLGFHFIEPLDTRVIDRLARNVRKSFPAQERLYDFSFHLNEKRGSKNVLPSGYRVRNADSAAVLILQPQTISVIRTAPYTSWEDLFECAQDVWSKLKKVAGRPALSRLSARYINRIDIRAVASEGSAVTLSTYVNAGIVLPASLNDHRLEGFQMSASLKGADNVTRILQLRTEPSPLIDHVALVLDIDVATNDAIPSREEAMWEVAGKLRHVKNEFFETIITDDSRRLFG